MAEIESTSDPSKPRSTLFEKTLQRTREKAARVKRTEIWWGDIYVGTAEALVAHGLVTVDELPGQPGRGNFAVTYYDSMQVKKYVKAPAEDEKWKRVARRGKKFEVSFGLPDEERRKRRLASDLRDRASMNKARLTQDNSWGEWARLPRDGRRRAQAALRSAGWERHVQDDETRIALLHLLDAADEDELERTLDPPSLCLARSTLERIAVIARKS